MTCMFSQFKGSGRSQDSYVTKICVRLRHINIVHKITGMSSVPDWIVVFAWQQPPMTTVDSVWSLIRVGLESDTPRSSPIHSERHRAPRFPFVAGIQVTDLVTEKQLAAHIEDLSLFGCFVETVDPFPAGTKVRLRISYGGANVLAQGTIAYSRDNGGMGIGFTSVEPSTLPILDAWLDDLRKK